ncbi:hypothetical protein [Bradyrhizobium sp. USDA 3458]|uniref:hypothetical protein n=1 Tax=Bradyrhizobium sp. USDA 3458 TaxID=2591461 RepID=UPI001FEF6D77|nr:hypothetical protein [Bradyrhizobium sp. USDA 3458]
MELIQIKLEAVFLGILLWPNDHVAGRDNCLSEGKMPAVIMQFVSHPRTGSDLATIPPLAKDGASLWRKHGADVGYWSVIGGEIGNYAFVARFDSVETYGRTLASLGADPAFFEFQAKRLKAGQSIGCAPMLLSKSISDGAPSRPNARPSLGRSLATRSMSGTRPNFGNIV